MAKKQKIRNSKHSRLKLPTHLQLKINWSISTLVYDAEEENERAKNPFGYLVMDGQEVQIIRTAEEIETPMDKS